MPKRKAGVTANTDSCQSVSSLKQVKLETSLVVSTIPPSLPCLQGIAASLFKVERRLGQQLESLEYGEKVVYMYNPLEYAAYLHSVFLDKFLHGKAKVLFLGMNPGPFGMCQTGIPFGEITTVRDWMKITGPVNKPAREFDKRPVLGMDCKRAEPSGKRFWSFFAQLCGCPEKFFQEAYVHNYCPLAYMDFKGKNVTPVDMKAQIRKQVETYCDAALVEIIKILGCDKIVGIGKYAEEKGKKVVEAGQLPIQVATIMHPSPINPRANGGQWEISVTESLKQLGMYELFKGT